MLLSGAEEEDEGDDDDDDLPADDLPADEFEDDEGEQSEELEVEKQARLLDAKAAEDRSAVIPLFCLLLPFCERLASCPLQEAGR